jgi:ubiquinone/menaquinone biosynthesis C-methylase UbiE
MASLARFVGSIPELYDRHMGPVFFEPYALDLAGRLPAGTRRILEIAAGTGRVTRHLLGPLAHDGVLVATDLNEPMIAEAQKRVIDSRVTWRTADAQALPFKGDDEPFDVVVCQFGLMFVPDKLLALREMRRVLRPGGTLLLSVWDELGRNPAHKRLHELAFQLTPENPPVFMATPFSMSDAQALRSMASDAGFSSVKLDTVVKTGEGVSAMDIATGFVRGNPLWNQLVERGIDADAFQAHVASVLAQEYGDMPCKSPMSAHVLTAVA